MATAPSVTISLPTVHALRVATAAALCLVGVAVFRLEHGNLAVWTTHMVLVQYDFTAFQKGIERILGRGLGILAGLVLLMLFRNTPMLGFGFELMAQVPFFYVYFSSRLAYTFLNAGLYLAVMMNVGRHDLALAAPEGEAMFAAVVVGVAVAMVVTWLSGAEQDLRIQFAGQPLRPVDPGRLRRSVQLAITVGLTQIVTAWLCLPTTTSIVSTMLLTIAPDLHATIRKGELRIAGAALALVYAALALFLLSRLPHFPLLVVLLFLGMFLAAYLARTARTAGYVGVQMGLVLPMVLVVPPAEVGSWRAAADRGIGVLIALACTLIVGVATELFRRAKPAAESR